MGFFKFEQQPKISEFKLTLKKIDEMKEEIYNTAKFQIIYNGCSEIIDDFTIGDYGIVTIHYREIDFSSMKISPAKTSIISGDFRIFELERKL